MILQKAEINPPKIKQMLADPQKRSKILKMIIQTLYNLGYEESANNLEKQSTVTYMKPEIQTMRNFLPEEKYQQLELYWKENQIDVPEQVKKIILELKCMKYIRQGHMERVLEILQADDPFQQAHQSSTALIVAGKQNKTNYWQKMKEKMSEELMVGDGSIPQNQIKEMHEYIIQKILESDIQPRSMEKVLEKFIQLQGFGLTASLGFRLLQGSLDPDLNQSIIHSDIRPPTKVLHTVASMKSLKKITYIKFCPDTPTELLKKKNKMFLVMSGNRKMKFLSLWQIVQINYTWNSKLNLVAQLQIQFPDQIMNVNWCDSIPHFIVTTTSMVYIFKITMQEKIQLNIQQISYKIVQLHKKQITFPNNRHVRLLSAEYNPLTNFIYIGSSNQSICVYNETLQSQVLTIQPIFRTRIIKFVFEGTMMLAVSASKCMILLYDLFQMGEINKFSLPQPDSSDILSIKICSKSSNNHKKRQGRYSIHEIDDHENSEMEKILVVTSTKIYYINIQSSANRIGQFFTIQYTLNNPFAQQSELTEFETMVYADKYVVSLGNKQFHAYELEKMDKNQDKKQKIIVQLPSAPITDKKKQHRWNSKNSFTFDILNNVMVSGNKQLMLWGYNPLNQIEKKGTRERKKNDNKHDSNRVESPSHSSQSGQQDHENYVDNAEVFAPQGHQQEYEDVNQHSVQNQDRRRQEQLLGLRQQQRLRLLMRPLQDRFGGMMRLQPHQFPNFQQQLIQQQQRQQQEQEQEQEQALSDSPSEPDMGFVDLDGDENANEDVHDEIDDEDDS